MKPQGSSRFTVDNKAVVVGIHGFLGFKKTALLTLLDKCTVTETLLLGYSRLMLSCRKEKKHCFWRFPL